MAMSDEVEQQEKIPKVIFYFNWLNIVFVIVLLLRYSLGFVGYLSAIDGQYLALAIAICLFSVFCRLKVSLSSWMIMFAFLLAFVSLFFSMAFPEKMGINSFRNSKFDTFWGFSVAGSISPTPSCCLW